jgi:peptidoglycan hydrolase-like protein with peptidoglycan-binding domain
VCVYEFLNTGTVDLVYGNVEVLNGAAFTAILVKSASGTAIASGVTVAGTFNANTLAFTDQTLTLSGTAGNLVGAAGDRLGIITTGTAGTAMVASLSFRIHP